MRKKLFLSTLAIVLITLILSMLTINLVFKWQFTNYLTRTAETTLEQLPSRLSNSYQNKGGWDTTSLNEVSHSLPMGTEVTLKDPKGNLIATLTNPMDAMMNKGSEHVMGLGINYSFNNWKTKTLTVTMSQILLATAVVRYPASTVILNSQDLSFVSTILYSLLFAGSLALLIGVLLSYWTSRHLVSPLQRLTEAAYRIGQGQLNERVPISTKDEVGQLAQAFNSMADNLKHQENLRKQFTADIAHELRTPLTSIRSYIEAFQDGVLPASYDNLTSLNEEIDRLVGLASDLRDLNVAEIGALKLNLQALDLGNLLDKVIRNLSSLIQDKELNLIWHKPTTSVLMQGDERLLTRLFYNLIHNAYKYTETDGKIIVDLKSFTNSVHIQISDTGNGISEDDLPFIFERFYRADKSRIRETGGTGIGLALVQQITTLHQGTIRTDSKIGQGTIFKINFPKEMTL